LSITENYGEGQGVKVNRCGGVVIE